MASSGNTWCKKLMAKQKKYSQRHTRARFVKTFEHQNQPSDKPKVREFTAPLKEGFNPGRGKKGTLSREYRAMVEARHAARKAFFDGLAG